MRVAILGTGKMGGAMARRLASAGHELTLWNRTRERAEALGVGKVAATPAEAAQNADVVISMLTDANAVRGAYLGDNGAAKAAQRQAFVDMSTAGPDISKELAPLIERTGSQFVEAPVLNGRKAALLEHRYEPVSFALRDALKDLRLALDLYKRAGATTPITRATEELFERASQSVGSLDMGAIASLYERQPATSRKG